MPEPLQFCPFCGARVPLGGQRFCATCGRELAAQPPSGGVPRDEPTPNQPGPVEARQEAHEEPPSAAAGPGSLPAQGAEPEMSAMEAEPPSEATLTEPPPAPHRPASDTPAAVSRAASGGAAGGAGSAVEDARGDTGSMANATQPEPGGTPREDQSQSRPSGTPAPGASGAAGGTFNRDLARQYEDLRQGFTLGDFMTFRFMITPPLITIIYIIAVVIITLASLFTLTQNVLAGIFIWVALMLWTRVVFEVMIVLFRINDGVQTIARRR